eukprot:GHVS01077706.1.p1 GENE.GHVS01077706.1~~GHVS01077706.1.p1  ORF type:complete len:723 (-),score=149.92 GHVS01077706.1:96-2264(-)
MLVVALRLVLWPCVAVLIYYAIKSVVDESAAPTSCLHRIVIGGDTLYTPLYFDPAAPPTPPTAKEEVKEFQRVTAFIGQRGEEAEFFPDSMRKNIMQEKSHMRLLVLLSESSAGFTGGDHREQMVAMFDTLYGWDYESSFNVTQFDNEGMIQVVQHGKKDQSDGSPNDVRRRAWFGEGAVDAQFGVKVLLDSEMWRNSPVYLHVVMTSLPEREVVSPISSTLISRPLIPELLKKPRRYLLKDAWGEVLAAQLAQLNLQGLAVESVPARLEVGAVVEHRRLSENMLKKQFGTFTNMLGYNSEQDPEYPYKLPLWVNNFISPRNEYLPLVPLEGLAGAPRRAFEFAREFPRAAQCPARVLLGEEQQRLHYIQHHTTHNTTHTTHTTPHSTPHTPHTPHSTTSGGGNVLKEGWRDVRDTEIEIVYKPASYSYWFFFNMLGEAFSFIESHSVLTSYDVDSLKLMVTGSSPAVLGAVYAVAILHWVFQTISITSDIKFWRNLSSYQGFSVNALCLEMFMGASIFFYLLDVGDSKLVQFFVIARLVLLLWKISKLSRPRVSMYGGFLPYIWLESRRSMESQKGSTMAAAEAAWMRRLLLCMVPFVVLVSLYQLVFVPQRGWYSWFVTSLACCSYVGGFVAMTPQLYCNYLLKSVEHMPWRVLFYQFLNTFIDDLFALFIRAPQMHKMSVFRDDIVFIGFVYQRWLYRGRSPRSIEEVEAEEESRLKEE